MSNYFRKTLAALPYGYISASDRMCTRPSSPWLQISGLCLSSGVED